MKKWTYNTCRDKALEYSTRTEFSKCGSAYVISCRNGWLDDICSHMKSIQKVSGYWTFEKCKESALKYTNKKEFRKYDGGAYISASRNGWIGDICEHMVSMGSRIKRYVYSYEFKDGSVYIGLTYNLERRHKQHLNDKKSIVYGKLLNGYMSCYNILTDLLDVMDAQKEEDNYKKYYIQNGWCVLNKGKTGEGVGSLGGSYLIWDKDRCQEEASKYDCRSQYQKNNKSSYSSARNNGWLDDICSHMIGRNIKWSKEKCHVEALKYNTKIEFRVKNNKAYNSSYKNGWLDDICSHMVINTYEKGYWTKEKCHMEALKYRCRSEYKKESSSSYSRVIKNGWLDDICSHMSFKRKYNKYWTKVKCQEEALKFDRRGKFQKGSNSCYNTARRNGWLDDICSHMKKK